MVQASGVGAAAQLPKEDGARVLTKDLTTTMMRNDESIYSRLIKESTISLTPYSQARGTRHERGRV